MAKWTSRRPLSTKNSNTYSVMKHGHFFKPVPLLCVMLYSFYSTVKLRVQISHTNQISVCLFCLLSL